MLRTILVGALLLIGLCSSSNALREKRYSRANDSQPLAWPWQVLIKTGPKDFNTCGGSLISNSWVLTAAHCVRHLADDPMSFELVFGEHNRDVVEGTEVTAKIAEIVRNPDYETDNHSNDVALIKIKTPLDLSGKEKHLSAVCLALQPIDIQGLRCVGTGWGRNGEKGEMPSVLKQLELKLFTNRKQCERFHYLLSLGSKSKETVTEKQVCMVSKNNPFPEDGSSYGGACPGDSGGPLQCLHKNTWVQVGVTWSKTHCEQNPSVYNLVHKYADWIVKVTGYKLPTHCKL